MEAIKTYKRRLLVGVLLILALSLALGLTVTTPAQAGDSTVTLNVKDSGGNPLDGVTISYNDYGSHYVALGTTSAGQVIATLPDGNYLFRATLDYSNQYLNGTVPGTVDFQTAKFIVHVMDSGANNYPDIAVSYNDYGSHDLSMGTTDASGNASIELFPGNYRFKAYKDHTEQTGYLEVATSGDSGTIDFQTALFVVHVKHADGSDYPEISATFNDYGNHYLSMGSTDASGNASIELFPGNYKFRADKDHTEQTGYLEVATSGASGTIDFQMALAEGFARDCDSGDPIAGIKISFNDYGNHWLSMGLTGTDGKASIELFPGTAYSFQGYTQHTQQVKTVDLPVAGVVVEFNPTRICFTYPGSVKFNDYGTHWQPVPCDTYLFPGTYSFSFTDSGQTTYEEIEISGCSFTWPGGNEPPVADPNGPYLGAVNTPIAFDGTGSSDPDNDPLTYAWDFGDSIGTGTVAAPSHIYAAAGIYDVCLTVNDGTVDSEEVCTIAVAYDPAGGFVTGGGWIDSPVNEDYEYMQVGGKANFGFVSKYKKGADVPEGNTEFQFRAGDLNFHSTSYDWLVVTGSDYAVFKGIGTINDTGDYKFRIWAGDDSLDTFRIKIWTEDELGTETLYYDNGDDQTIGGGSIVVHTSKK